eukprot:UN03634
MILKHKELLCVQFESFLEFGQTHTVTRQINGENTEINMYALMFKRAGGIAILEQLLINDEEDHDEQHDAQLITTLLNILNEVVDDGSMMDTDPLTSVNN